VGVETNNNIDLVVSERGVSESAEKVLVLAVNAEKAGKGIGSLKEQLDSLRGSGLGDLVSSMDRYSASAEASRSATDSVTRSQRASAEASSAVVTGQKAETASSSALRTEKAALAKIESEAATNRKRYAQEQLGLWQAAAVAEKNAIELSIKQAAAEAAEASVMAEVTGLLEAQTVARQESIAVFLEEAEAYEAMSTFAADFNAALAAGIEEEQAYAAQIAATVAAQELRQVAMSATIEQQAVFGTTLAESQAALDGQGLATIATMDAQIAANTVAQETVAVTAVETASTDRFTGAIARLMAAEREQAGVQASVSAGSRGLVSANVAAGASLGLLEGRTISMTRAASNFLTKILPFGELLQVAFPVIGAIALVGVLVMGFNAAKKWNDEIERAPKSISEAFRSMNDELRGSNDSLQGVVDKLKQTNDKLEHKYDKQTGMQIVLDDLLKGADTLGKSLDNDLKKFNEIALKKENQVGAVGGFFKDKERTQPTYDEIGGIFAEIVRKQQETDKSASKMKQLLDAAVADPNADKTGPMSVESLRETVESIISRGKKDIADFRNASIAKIAGELAEGSGRTAGMQDNSAVQAIRANALDTLQEQARADGIRDQLQTQTVRNQKDRENKFDTEGAAKAARLQWAAALEAFKQYDDALAKSGHRTTATENDAWWKHPVNASGQALKFNLGAIGDNGKSANENKRTDEVGKYDDQIDDQQKWVNDQLDGMKRRDDAMTKYGQTLRETTALDKFEQEAQAKGIVLTAEQIAQYKASEDSIAKQAPYQKALNLVLKDGRETTAEFNLVSKAFTQVIAEHPEKTEDATRAMNKYREAYLSATDPMYEFNKSQRDANELLKYFGDEAQVVAAIQQAKNAADRNGNELTEENIRQMKIELELQHDDELYHRYIGELYADNADKLRDLAIKQSTLKNAYSEGKISGTAYATGSLANAEAQRQINDDQGKGKGSDIFASSLQKYTANFKDFATSAKNILGDMWKNIGEGAASTFSKLIVYGGSAKEALKSLAQEILSSLLNALIQVAIEAVAVKIGLSFIPGFSQGGSVPGFAMGGMVPGYAGGGSIQGYADGGISRAGIAASDTVLAWLTPGEYVMDKPSVDAIGVDTLDAMRNNVRAVAANSPGVGSKGLTVGGTSPKMVIEDHTKGVKWQTVQVGQDEMRVIARDEGKKAVYQHADDATARNMGDGNSKTRRSVHQNTTARPQR
jgi:hypothetical protein